MKVYKVVLMIIDHDDLGDEGIEQEIENARYANDCINPHVMRIEGVDIGEWHDNHLLNKRSTMTLEFNRLFPK